jgi:hypothetical protein
VLENVEIGSIGPVMEGAAWPMAGRVTLLTHRIHALLDATPAYALMWFEMAEFQLTRAEKQLKHAQDIVSKYGADFVSIP